MNKKEIIERILEKFNIRGFQLKPRPATKFAKEYFKNKPIEVIEIGTLRGDHAKQILDNLNVKKICLIDPWSSYSDYKISDPERTQESLNKDFKICRNVLKKYGKKVIYIKDFSDNAVNKVSEADYIYIDGNHEYKYVIKDIKNYYKKLRKGGILAGDDLGNSGVNKALIEFCYRNKLNFQSKIWDWWIIKK